MCSSDLVIFEFRDIFQTSRLVYEQSTGLLLEATTKVFGFELSFQINSIKGDQEYYKLEESSKSTEETIIFSPILITAALALITVKKKY